MSVFIFEDRNNTSFPPRKVIMRNNELIFLKHLEQCLVHAEHDESIHIDPVPYLKPRGTEMLLNSEFFRFWKGDMRCKFILPNSCSLGPAHCIPIN